MVGLGYGKNFLLHIQKTIVVYGQAPDQDHYLIFVEEKRKKTNGKLGKLSFQFRL